eukprot:TRINITY_DN111500_c0_g1_i1.p1 TRINITY_DN111500_c0_g1~~TRINITY_DN111500_c0_g1_i1.p1  ORF type:complete len:304 (-),score=77.47 TRINITY_DN111500_c0_g1_i1:61-930(-)
MTPRITGRRRTARVAAAAVATTAAVSLRRPLASTFVPPTTLAASSDGLERLGSLEALSSLTQLVLAQSEAAQPELSKPLQVAPVEQFNFDPFFYFYLGASALGLIAVFWILTEKYWKRRWLSESIQKLKLKFITQEDGAGPLDQYLLGMKYVELQDYPSALAEFEEVEEDFDEVRDKLDPEDTIGALACRAQLHNSKGIALMALEPPRTAQARREFVRAVTYWPEFPQALYNIGAELMKRKRFDVAVRTLNTALKWMPGNEKYADLAKKARQGADKELTEDELEELEMA